MAGEYRVIICGSRSWDDQEAIRDFINKLPTETVIIHGGAKGADLMAAACAHARGLQVREYPARWATLGKRAGALRNAEMLEVERPHLVAAFCKNLAASSDTRDMVRRAQLAGVPVEIQPPKPRGA